MTDFKSTSIFRIAQLLYKWRFFLSVYILILGIVTVTLVMIMPKTFSSRSTILPQTSSSVASLLPPSMTVGLGGAISSLNSEPGSDTFKIMSILKSRSFADSVINYFDLQNLFEVPTIEDAILQYREMVNITIDEEMMINVNTYTKTKFFHLEDDELFTKKLVFEMNEYIIKELERRFSELNSEEVRFQRITVEKRLNQNIADLESIEIKIKEFEELYGIISLSDQLSALIQNLANLESQIQIQEIELSVIQNSMIGGNQEVLQKQKIIDELSYQLENLVSDQDAQTILPSFNSLPDIKLRYAQLVRERVIQANLYDYLFQQFEQLNIQEIKETPSLQFIDTPVIPTKRISPTRSLTAILIFITGFIIGLLFIIITEEYHKTIKHHIAEIIS